MFASFSASLLFNNFDFLARAKKTKVTKKHRVIERVVEPPPQEPHPDEHVEYQQYDEYEHYDENYEHQSQENYDHHG